MTDSKRDFFPGAGGSSNEHAHVYFQLLIFNSVLRTSQDVIIEPTGKINRCSKRLSWYSNGTIGTFASKRRTFMCEKNQKKVLMNTIEERMESPNGRRTISSDADILFVTSLWVWPTFSHAVIDRIARLVDMPFISHYAFSPLYFDVSMYVYIRV